MVQFEIPILSHKWAICAVATTIRIALAHFV